MLRPSAVYPGTWAVYRRGRLVADRFGKKRWAADFVSANDVDGSGRAERRQMGVVS